MYNPLMSQDSIQPPLWASVGETENEHLSDLLSFASTNYGRHTDWFLRHYETGTKNLAAILAAESALFGVTFAQRTVAIPPSFIALLLGILACIALLLARLSVNSCRRSFTAALESAFLIAKVAWAMGLTSCVAVNKGVVGTMEGPGRKDRTLYGPRWVNDSLSYPTCEDFVAAYFANRKGTYFQTRSIIIAFCIAACVLGLTAAVLVIYFRFIRP